MYSQIARFYDLTHAHLTADREKVLALAKERSGPVLELGCGTGRLLAPLARAGFAVTGVDNAPAMLARARTKLEALSPDVQARVTVQKGDITELALDGRFALALLLNNTAMHFPPAQLTQVLRRARAHLTPEGRLFIDVANPFSVGATPNDQFLTLENSLIDPESGERLLQMASNRLDEEGQRLHITWIYDASPAEGGPVQRLVAEADYHYLYPHQWQMIFDETGLETVEMAGDYEGAPFNEEASRLLFLLRPR
jgi:SAM-dependent methyltransferase